MFREESEISILNGMSLCCAPVYINTLGAQPGLCLVLIVQESERQDLSKKLNRNGLPPDSHTCRLMRAWTRAPSAASDPGDPVCTYCSHDAQLEALFQEHLMYQQKGST